MQLVKDNIKLFLDSFFIQETNILHFGSSLHSKTFKDIDLIILSERNNVFTKEIFPFGSLSFDVISIPKQQIFQVIELNKINGVYVSVFEEGHIIKDGDNSIQEIKDLILRKKLHPPLLLKKQYLEQKFREAFEQIKVSKTLEAELIFYDLIEKLIEYRLLDFNILNSVKIKNKYREISRFDPSYLKKLTSIKDNFLKNKSYEQLLTDLNSSINIKKVISKKYYSTSYSLSAIYDNNLIIQIKRINSNKSFLSFIKTVIVPLKINFYYFKVENNTSILLEEAYYITLIDSNIALNKVLIKLEPLKKSIEFNHLLITYPYQLKLSAFLGQFDLLKFKKQEENFVQISRFISRNYSKKSNTIFWFLNLLIGSCLNSGISKNQFLDIISNFGTLYGQSFLSNDKEHRKHIYHKLDLSNDNSNFRNTIKSTYKEVIEKWDIQHLPYSKINELIKSLTINTMQNKIPLLNFLSNILFVNEQYLIYIFHIIGEISQNADEH